MNTRSKCSNQVCGLSTTAYGGGGIVPSSLTATRFGPTAPRCSQTDDDPGPPLNTKHTGRGGAASSCRYAIVNTAACGCPSSFASDGGSTGMNCERTV